MAAMNNRHLIHCANCGCIGHVYKTCNHPITSYGIICYKREYNPWKKTMTPKFMMVQRKDSLNYVEFIRGKYDLHDITYIKNLFMRMTPGERNLIAHNPFDALWKELWKVDKLMMYQREYNDSKAKFETLTTGVLSHLGKVVNIAFILEHTSSDIAEAEYGFPKGRRNINEMDVTCAVREFIEETGLALHQFKLLNGLKTFEETFIGSNKVRYRHIYYIACCKDNGRETYSLNKTQVLEVQNVKWFTYDEAMRKIPVQNVERKELFKRINNMLKNSAYHQS